MLNLRQIEAFRATMEGRSVTAAGRAMNLTQPSVTRLLHDLERSLGFQLFSRHRRGMTPTPEARLLYDEVERSFLGLRELSAAADHIREFKSRRLTLGASPALALAFVPALIAELTADQPGISIATQVSDSSRLLGEVRAGRLSLAILTPVESAEDVEILARRSAPYLAVLPAGHALGSREFLDLDCLEPRRTILPEPTFIVAKCPNKAVAARLLELSEMTVEVSFAAVSMVRHGLGIALIDPFTADFFSGDEGLVIKPFRDAPIVDMILAQPKNLATSPLQTRFVERAVERLDRLPIPTT